MNRIQPVNPPSLMKPAGFSHGYEVKGGRLLFVAGQVAKDASGTVVGAGDVVAQFKDLGPVYRELFGKHFPAMTLVGARDLFDATDGCLIEIEAVPVLG